MEATGKIERAVYRIPPDILHKIRLGLINEEEWFEANKDKFTPEVKTGTNVWLNSFWDELLKLATGVTATAFSAANVQGGVGDSSTSAAATQTDLLATTNKQYVALTSGYPTAPSSQTIQFKFQFATSLANFAHNELVIKNITSGICWNRNATGWGTKTSSEIWIYTVTLGKA